MSNVFENSSIRTCRILNICCFFLQAGAVEKIKQIFKIRHVQINFFSCQISSFFNPISKYWWHHCNTFISQYKKESPLVINKNSYISIKKSLLYRIRKLVCCVSSLGTIHVCLTIAIDDNFPVHTHSRLIRNVSYFSMKVWVLLFLIDFVIRVKN